MIPPQLEQHDVRPRRLRSDPERRTPPRIARASCGGRSRRERPMKLAATATRCTTSATCSASTTTARCAWAYSNPRVELVASEDTGAAIVAISQTGDLVALDPRPARCALAERRSARRAPVLGATFDADGWSPPAQGEQIETVAGARRDRARSRCALRSREGARGRRRSRSCPAARSRKELLGVLADKRAPQHLKDTVVDLLVARKDPASLPVLTAQLAVHDDFIAQDRARSRSARSRRRSPGSAARSSIRPRSRAALVALQSHLDAPTTQVADLVFVIDAMAAIGGGEERPALGSHLLLYHADDDLGGDPAWGKAIVAALDDHGGPGERELLRQVAADPRTKPGLVAVDPRRARATIERRPRRQLLCSVLAAASVQDRDLPRPRVRRSPRIERASRGVSRSALEAHGVRDRRPSSRGRAASGAARRARTSSCASSSARARTALRSAAGLRPCRARAARQLCIIGWTRSRVERVVVQHVIGGQIVREFIERPGILHSQPVGSTQKDS